VCGVVLVWKWDELGAGPSTVLSATAAQRHRGPDGHGYALWRQSPRVGRAGPAYSPEVWRGRLDQPARISPDRFRLALGHTWLAIQDRHERARQPMSTSNGRYWIVLNGEIYNAAETRALFMRAGRRFVTLSDTEVLLALWEQDGPYALERVRGMFAFVIYDSQDDVVWLGRDRIGIKPLYFSLLPRDCGVVAASEFRGIHATGLVPRLIDPLAAKAFLAAAVTTPGESRTFFEEVNEVPPGCVLALRPGHQTVHRYYQLPSLNPTVGEEGIAALRDELVEAVRLHLTGSREVGLLLSGGLDSTTVARTLAAQSPDRISVTPAFTFGRETSDDAQLAALAASHLGLSLERIEPPDQIPIGALVDLAIALETPIHTWGPLNEYLLLAHISERHQLSVLLSGQGGDEVLSGYPWFQPLIEAYISQRSGPQEAAHFSSLCRQRSLLDPALLEVTQRIYQSRQAWLDLLSAGALEVMNLTAPEVLSWGPVQYYLNDQLGWDEFRRHEISCRELPHLLRQEDRLGMWFSIETRVPLVDHVLIELVGSLSPAMIAGDGWLKYPLRVVFPDQPDLVRFNARKYGFWENASALCPYFSLYVHLAVRDSEWMQDVARPGEVTRLEPMVQWRFLQVALLSAVNSRQEAAEWLTTMSSEVASIIGCSAHSS
jgi:asparagine synthase (glutamine-hydrolysing)